MTERRTVTFSDPVVRDLIWLSEEDDCSLTDAHNRAVRSYALIRKSMKEGSRLTLRDPDGSETAILLA